jgi:hypothetical protein
LSGFTVECSTTHALLLGAAGLSVDTYAYIEKYLLNCDS